MEFGIFHEFLIAHTGSQAEALRLRELREAAHLDGISAEINPGSLLSHEQVMNSLRLYCQEVMSQFK